MKKILFVVCFVAFIFPASLFAHPTNEEVGEVLSAVLALYMGNLFAIAFTGNTDTVKVNEIENGAEMIFKNYDSRKFGQSLGAMGQTQGKEKSNHKTFKFEKISGKVVMYGSGDSPNAFFIDVTLTKCPVRTLWLKTSEKDKKGELRVNGKVYKNAERFFELMYKANK